MLALICFCESTFNCFSDDDDDFEEFIFPRMSLFMQIMLEIMLDNIRKKLTWSCENVKVP